ncbi:MAG: short-chain dehydrogenase [Anaerolineae bacterium]|nr:MAG: short-chain dehydrogenase [Anaerolineae bacterium]
MPETKISAATPLQARRTAIVVGASSGIGAALTRKLAAEGYLVAAVARRAELLASLCNEINAAHGETRALPFIHDVTDYDSVPSTLQNILQTFGRLDLFVYNAGIQQHVKLDEFDFRKDRAMIETNLLGAMAWLNPVAAMFHHLRAGHIVGISSVAGDRGRIGAPAYNTSKAALSTYLESLRNRLTRRGVTVTTIKPGFVETDILRSAPKKNFFWLISPEQAAEGIWKAIQSRKQTAYVPAQWGLLMLVIRHIPSFIFRRLSF